jgi:hypothetical protein
VSLVSPIHKNPFPASTASSCWTALQHAAVFLFVAAVGGSFTMWRPGSHAVSFPLTDKKPRGWRYVFVHLQTTGRAIMSHHRNHSSCCTHHICVETAQWLSDWTRGNVSYFNITHSGHSVLRWHRCLAAKEPVLPFSPQSRPKPVTILRSLSQTKCHFRPRQATDFFSASSGKAWHRCWSPVPLRKNSWGKPQWQSSGLVPFSDARHGSCDSVHNFDG